MADPQLDFNPTDGWENETVFVKNPVSEAQTRTLFQRLFTQIQTYLNTTYTTWINATFATITSLNAAVLSGISDDSMTNAKLATDVKIGSNATLTTTHKTTVVGAVNEINAKVPTGTIVGTSDTQVLTNKTLTSPVINTGVSGTAIDTDVTLAANVDTKLATQKATKTYADTKIAKSVITASGDLIIGTGANTPAVLAKGTDGDILTLAAGFPAWGTKLTGITGSGSDTSTAYTTGTVTKTIALGCSPKLIDIRLRNAADGNYWSRHLITASSDICPFSVFNSTVYSYYSNYNFTSSPSGGSNLTFYSAVISGTNLIITLTCGGSVTLKMDWVWGAIY
jgi:hypothetical protein